MTKILYSTTVKDYKVVLGETFFELFPRDWVRISYSIEFYYRGVNLDQEYIVIKGGLNKALKQFVKSVNEIREFY